MALYQMRITLLFFFLFCLLQPSAAQEKNMEGYHITITLKDRPFQEALTIIESKVPFKFAYSTDLVLHQKNVSLTATNIALPDLLSIVLRGTYLTYHIIGHQIVLQSVVLRPGITLSGYIKD